MSKNKKVALRTIIKCNNNCLGCTTSDMRSGKNEKETLLKLISDSRKQHCNEIVFTRGDPLLHPDLIEVISFSKSQDYKIIQLQTNGRLLFYTDYTDALISAGINVFEITLFSANKLIHDKITRVKGSCQQTMKGLENVLAHKNVDINLNIPILKYNYKHLCATVKYLYSLGIRNINFSFLRPTTSKNVLVKLSALKSSLLKTLDYCQQQGIHYSTEAIPFCCLGKHIDQASEIDLPDITIYEINSTKSRKLKNIRRTYLMSKAVQCKQCSYYNSCFGTWKKYLDLFGSKELKPITNEK
ncbi:radical SAM protein [Candidatus Margulisiibacteriota bacterium]